MTRQYLHTNEQKQDMCLKIIRSLRHHDTFTVRMVAQATGLGSMIDAKFVRLLQDIGSVHAVRRKGSQVYYAFDDRAASKVRANFSGLSGEPTPVAKARMSAAKTRAAIVRDKSPVQKSRSRAFEEGYGRSIITRIDAMLREVRCGMPTVQ